MAPLYVEIATANGLDPESIEEAVAIACITRAEWASDPDACMARINGALEESYESI